jgi:membrane glycosyltransferase
MVFAFLWGTILFLTNRSFFWWNTPIILPLLFSGPLSVWLSRPDIGQKLRKLGLFLIPEEVEPPGEVRLLREILERRVKECQTLPIPWGDGFVRAVVDPHVNALHLSFLRRERSVSPAISQRRQNLRERAITCGPESLTAREKKELLGDPASVHLLHQALWERADPGQAQMWGLP